MLGIADLAVKHPYYCSDSNWTDNTALEIFNSFEDFLADWGDMDSDYIDMNLCFRWDIKLTQDFVDDRYEGGYSMNIYFMQQRRGHFKPVKINNVKDSDVEAILRFLEPHLAKLKELWAPFKM